MARSPLIILPSLAGAAALRGIPSQLIYQSGSAARRLPPQCHRFSTITSTLHPIPALKHAISSYPLTTAAFWAYHNSVAAAGVCGVLYFCGVAAPLELGAAFMLNAALRRARVPLIIGLSAVTVRLFPVLETVPVSRLVVIPVLLLIGEPPAPGAAAGTAPSSDKAQPGVASVNAFDPADAVISRDSTAVEPRAVEPLGFNRSTQLPVPPTPVANRSTQLPVPPTPVANRSTQLPVPPTPVASPPFAPASTPSAIVWSYVLRALRALHPVTGSVGAWGMSVMDSYGLGYSVSARAVASANLLLLYAALRYGVDLSVALGWLGVDLSTAGAAATGAQMLSLWAASCLVVNALWFPVVLHAGVTYPALKLGPWLEPRIRETADLLAADVGHLRRKLGGQS